MKLFKLGLITTTFGKRLAENFDFLTEIILVSATCPEEMPIAKTFGYGASAINYCCPTDELVRPPITGGTAENQCAACYKTALSNCGNYGEYPFFQFCIETRWVSDGVSAVNENFLKKTDEIAGSDIDQTTLGTTVDESSSAKTESFSDGVSTVNENLLENMGTNTEENAGENASSNVDTNSGETTEDGSSSAETHSLTIEQVGNVPNNGEYSLLQYRIDNR